MRFRRLWRRKANSVRRKCRGKHAGSDARPGTSAPPTTLTPVSGATLKMRNATRRSENKVAHTFAPEHSTWESS